VKTPCSPLDPYRVDRLGVVWLTFSVSSLKQYLLYWVCFLFLLAANPVRALSEEAPISIPSELGRIEMRHTSKIPEAPQVVLIQDAHSHYEAQRSLAEILRRLVLAHGLKLVLVEGGVGDVDLSYLREGVPQDRAGEVAETFLKAGKISGEEFLDLTLENDEIRLWGLEDPSLYRQNIEAYLNFFKVQRQALEEVSPLKAKALELRTKHYPAELLEIEILKEKAEAKEISLLVYFQALTERAQGIGIELNPFPTFREWLKIREKEKDLDPSRLELEKKELTQALSRALTKEELYPLRQEWKNSDLGGEAPLLRTLLEMKKEYRPRFDRASTAQIEKALHLMKEAEGLGAAELFQEADQIQGEIRARLLSSEEGKRTADLIDYLTLAEKLFKLGWTPRDLKRFEALEGRWDPQGSEALLDSGGGLEKVSRQVPLAKQFYEIAQKREAALFENAVQKMEAERQKLYAVIVGGFHAEDLADRFQKHGFSVLMVRPRFELSEEPSPYFEVLREKWGTGEDWPLSS